MSRLNGIHARLMEVTKKLIDDESLAKLDSLHEHLSGVKSPSEKTDSFKRGSQNLGEDRKKSQKQIQVEDVASASSNKKNLPELNLQNTLMELQKEYLDYELQRAKHEFQVLDLYQIEDEMARSFELEEIVNESNKQTNQQKKKKSEFIDLLKKCRICSESDLNYASKPFKLVKKLKDVRIMFERKSNNLEQQMKKSNMNKNRIIEDIKADKVLIRKALPEQAQYYLSEIQNNRQSKKRNTQKFPTEPSRFFLNTSTNPIDNQNHTNQTINLKSSNSNILLPLKQQNSQSPSKGQVEQKQKRETQLFNSRPSQIIVPTQSFSSEVISKPFLNRSSQIFGQIPKNESPIVKDNIITILNANPYLINLKSSNSNNSNNNSSSTYSFNTKKNSTFNLNSPSNSSNQDANQVSFFSKQRNSRHSTINFLTGLVLQHKNSKSQNKFINLSAIKNEQPFEKLSIEKQQYQLYLQSLKSQEPPTINLNNSLPSYPTTNNNQILQSKDLKQQQVRQLENQNDLKLNTVLSTNSLKFSSSKNDLSLNTFKNNVSERRKFKTNLSPNKSRFKSEQMSPQVERLPQAQNSSTFSNEINKMNVASRVYDTPNKKSAPKQGILANVYNFEEDSYFKHQQIYKFEQEKAQIVQIRRNATDQNNKNNFDNKNKDIKSKILMTEGYLHDEFSSNDDSIPSATEIQLENCYEESIKIQKKMIEADKGDLPSKIKGLLRIETVNNEIKQLMHRITKK